MLTVLAVFFTLYVASDLIVPIVMAIVLNLLLQPPKRLLCNRLRIPAPITSLLLILALFSLVGAIGAAISVPASGWIAKAPESLPTLEKKLSYLRQPLGYIQQGMQKMEQLVQSSGEPGERQSAPPSRPASSASSAASLGSVGLSVLSGTRAFVGNLFMLVVVLFFLLSSGDSLLRRLVEVRAAVPRQAPPCRDQRGDRAEHLGLSADHHDHEYAGRHRGRAGDMGLRPARPPALGHDGLSPELHSYPWPVLRGRGVLLRRTAYLRPSLVRLHPGRPSIS